jgi:bifunctional non-homologous end joining protein LigD
MPQYIEPQLCALVDEPPGGGWVHEIKLDGYRIQARIERRKAVLRSRKGLDWTHRFQEIATDCEKLANCIIDGEICAVDRHGMPSFAGLQEALSSGKTATLIYYVFDLMWLDREDYRPWALSTRKKVLERLQKQLNQPRLRYVEHHEGSGAAMFKSACRLKLEGIVSKKVEATYISGRRGQWTKTKCRPRQELVIGGWEMNGARFSSLLLGAYRDGKLAYVGTAGTGFNSRNLPPMTAKLKKLETPASPFQTASPRKSSSIHFVEPVSSVR